MFVCLFVLKKGRHWKEGVKDWGAHDVQVGGPLEFLNQLKQIMLSVFHQAQASDWPSLVP